MIDIAGDDSIAAEAIILSTPASAASDLLGELNQGVSTLLAKINSPHLSVINLLYEEPDAAKAPKAFGALHSQDGHSDLLGVLHESHIFPGRRSDGRLHLRVMIGGAMRPEMKAYSDSKLSESAVAELRRLHGFASDPSIMSLKRWNSSIPQYELGHARLISDVSAALKADPSSPIALAGNYLQGVSLSDTASSGRVAAQKILDLLAS